MTIGRHYIPDNVLKPLCWLLTVSAIIKSFPFMNLPWPVETSFGWCVPLQGALSIIIVLVLLPWHNLKSIAVNWWLAAFFAVCAGSLLLYPHPYFTTRLGKLIAFLIGLACFSPLITAQSLHSMRKILYNSFGGASLAAAICVILIWFIYTVKFPGISAQMLTDLRLYGIIIHGMTLSPLSAIAAIWLIFKIPQAKRSHRIYLASAAALCVLSMIICGSRIAIVSFIAASFIPAYFYREKLRHTLRQRNTWLFAGALCIIGAAALPSALTIVQYKNSISRDAGSITYSRDSIWQDRLSEIKASPITGIGFAQPRLPESYIQKDIDASENTHKIYPKYEPGSNYLMLLSNTGIIGLISFLLFIVALLRSSIPGIASASPLRLSALTIFVFFLFHGICEGWLLSTGSALFPIFWLAVSLVATPEKKTARLS